MADLTTLASVKAWAGVTGSADDTLLSQLITAYSAWVEQYIGRGILSASYQRYLSGRDNVGQSLPEYPIISVQSLTIDGLAIPQRANDGANGYFFDENSIILVGYRFCRGRSNIAITWTAGYAAVPPDIAQAVNELIGLRYTNKDHQGWSSKSLAGETVSLVTKDMPDSVRTVLDAYRSIVPV